MLEDFIIKKTKAAKAAFAVLLAKLANVVAGIVRFLGSAFAAALATIPESRNH